MYVLCWWVLVHWVVLKAGQFVLPNEGLEILQGVLGC